MQKTKALIWLFPGNIRRVEKQADSYFWGVDAQEIPGGKPEVWLALPSELCRMTLSRVEFLMLAPGKSAFANSVNILLKGEACNTFYYKDSSLVWVIVRIES